MDLSKLEELENRLEKLQKLDEESEKLKTVIERIKQLYPGYAGKIISEEFVTKEMSDGT